MPVKYFKAEGKLYSIDDDKVVDFKKDFPSANEVQLFKADNKTYTIPVSQVSDFLKDMPNAAAYDPLKKKENSDPNKPIELNIGGKEDATVLQPSVEEFSAQLPNVLNDLSKPLFGSESKSESFSQQIAQSGKIGNKPLDISSIPAPAADDIILRRHVRSNIEQILPSLEQQQKELSTQIDEYVATHKGTTSNIIRPGISGQLALAKQQEATDYPELAELKNKLTIVNTSKEMLQKAYDLAAESKSEHSDVSWWSNMIDSFRNADWSDVLTLGIKSLDQDNDLFNIAHEGTTDGLENLSPEKKSLLAAYAALREVQGMRDQRVSSMAADMTVSAIPFMAQYALTDGVGAVVKETMAKTAATMIEKYGSNAAAGLFIKGAMKGSSLFAQGAARSLFTTMAPEAVIGRKLQTTSVIGGFDADGNLSVKSITPGEGWTEAASKGLMSNALAFAWAGAGGEITAGLNKVFSPITKPILSRMTPLFDAINNTSVGGWIAKSWVDNSMLKSAKTLAGWHGIIGQTGEMLGMTYSQALVTGDKPVLDAVSRKDLLAMVASVSAMGGAFWGINAAMGKRVSTPKPPLLDPEMVKGLDEIAQVKNVDEFASKFSDFIDNNATNPMEVSDMTKYAFGKVVANAMDAVKSVGDGLSGMEGEAVAKSLQTVVDGQREIGSKEKVSSSDLADMREADMDADALDAGLANKIKESIPDVVGRIEELENDKKSLYNNPPEEVNLVELSNKELSIDSELHSLYMKKNEVRSELLNQIRSSNEKSEKAQVGIGETVQGSGRGSGEERSQEPGSGSGNGRDEGARQEANAADGSGREAQGKALSPEELDAQVRDLEQKRDAEIAAIPPEEASRVDAVASEYDSKIDELKNSAKVEEQPAPKQIKEGETNVATEKGIIQEDNSRELSGTLQGQQEVGKSEGGERKATEPKADTGYSPERSGQVETKEKVTSYAMEANEPQSMSIFDELPKHKKAKEFDKVVNKFVKDNWRGLKDVSGRSFPVLIKKLRKLTPRNIDTQLPKIKQLLSDTELVKSIGDINDRLKLLKRKEGGQLLKNVMGQTPIKLRGNAGWKGITAFLNGMKLENIDSPALIRDLDVITKNLVQKVPDLSNVPSFMEKWQSTIDDTFFDSLVKQPASKVDAGKLVLKIADVSGRIADIVSKLNKGEAVSIDEIREAKNGIKAMRSAVSSMINKGDVEVGGDGRLMAMSKELDGFDGFLNNDIPTLTEHGAVALKEAEFSYKQMLKPTIESKLLSSIKLLEDAKNTVWSSKLRDLMHVMRLSSEGRGFLDRTSIADLDVINAALDRINDTGFIPTQLADSYIGVKKAFIADRVHKTIGISDKLIEDAKRLCGGSVEVDKILRYIQSTNAANIESLFARAIDLQKSPLYVEIYNDLNTTVAASRRMAHEMIEPMSELAHRMISGDIKVGRNKFMELKAKWISTPEQVPEKVRKVFIKAGIVMANRRFFNLMHSKPLITEVNGEYLLIKPDGTKVADANGDPMVFNSPKEATTYHSEHKAEMFSPDMLDLFYMLNFGNLKEEARNASLSSNPKRNRSEVELFQKCYNELTNNGERRLVMDSDEAIANTLSGAEMKAYQTIRGIYDNPSTQEMIAFAGAVDGISTGLEPDYYPMNIKSGDSVTDMSDVISDIFNNAEGRKTIPGILGNVYSKSDKVIRYIDFDAFRATYRYNNHLNVSAGVVPMIRSTLGALSSLSKEYGGDRGRFIKAFSTDLKYGLQMEYNRNAIYSFLPSVAGRTMRALLRNFSSYLLLSVPRKYIDYSSQLFTSAAYTGSFRPTTLPHDKPMQIMQFFNFPENYGEAAAHASMDRLNRYNLEAGTPYAGKSWLEKKAESRLTSADHKNQMDWWWTYMTKTFKRLTGKDFDLDAYVAEDGAYRNAMFDEPAFREAKALANKMQEATMKATTHVTDARYMGRLLHSNLTSREGPITKMFMPMAAFNVAAARSAFGEARILFTGHGDQRVAAARKLAGIAARDATYMLMYQVVFNSLAVGAGAFVDWYNDDKEYEATKAGLDAFKRTFSPEGGMMNIGATAFGLLFGGYGNLGRVVAGLATSTVPRAIIQTWDRYNDPAATRRHLMAYDQLLKVSGVQRQITDVKIQDGRIQLSDAGNILFPVLGGAISQMASSGVDLFDGIQNLNTPNSDTRFEHVCRAVEAVNTLSAITCGTAFLGAKDINMLIEDAARKMTYKDGTTNSNAVINMMREDEAIYREFTKRSEISKENAMDYSEGKLFDLSYSGIIKFVDENKKGMGILRSLYAYATSDRYNVPPETRRAIFKAIGAEFDPYSEALASGKLYVPSPDVFKYYEELGLDALSKDIMHMEAMSDIYGSEQVKEKTDDKK